MVNLLAGNRTREGIHLQWRCMFSLLGRDLNAFKSSRVCSDSPWDHHDIIQKFTDKKSSKKYNLELFILFSTPVILVFDSPQARGGATLEDMTKYPIVSVKAADGLTLHGLLNGPKLQAKTVVIHLHGCGGNFYGNRYFDLLSKAVCDLGIAYL